MRTLKFVINDQLMSLDPSCDFTGLVPGTEGYMQAEFSFSPEWDNCVKVAEFIGRSDNDCIPQLLKNGKNCLIPAEVLKRHAFGVRVVGKRDKLKLKTNKIIVRQKGD